jgi:uncharacterized protein YqeY
MPLREDLTAATKTAMLARDAERTSTLRMIAAKLKDSDIAARPKGITAIPDDEIIAMLRSMIKSRRDAVALYRQGRKSLLLKNFYPRPWPATGSPPRSRQPSPRPAPPRPRIWAR